MHKFQKFFDIAVTGVITQNALAKGDHNNCVYRTPEGHACAIGHLMADGYFEPWMNDDVNVWNRGLQEPYPSEARKGSHRAISLIRRPPYLSHPTTPTQQAED